MKNRSFRIPASLILVLFVSAVAGRAATCTVTKTADTNDGVCDAADCSLREAVAEPTCATIDLPLDLAGQTVGLTQGEIKIARSLTIRALGADAFTISGNGISRIFVIKNGATVNISGLTLTGGNGVGELPGDGGAIRTHGYLILDRVVVKNNAVCTTCHGSAISAYASDTTEIRNSTVSGNPAGSMGTGAISAESGFVFVINSTAAFNEGAAFYAAGGQVKLVQSTVASNGMGVLLAGLGTLTAANSVVRDICRCHQKTAYSSEGYNIISTLPQSLPIPLQEGDRDGIDPLLGPLQYNGGTTPTIAPYGGSPVIDTGSNFLAISFYTLTADQRGFARIFDGDGNGTATVDVGAVEAYAAPSLAPVQIAGRVLGAVSGNPLRGTVVTLTDFQGNTRTAISSSLGWFVFDALPAGRAYRISVSARRGTQQKNVFADQNISDADVAIPGL